MIASEIRFWLMRQPRPAMVRVLCGTERTTVPVAAGQSWASVAQSVEALGPDLLEALDSNGNTIRATRGEELDGEQEAPPPSVASPAPALAPVPPALIVDAETARFELFARLLTDSVNSAQARSEKFITTAFDKLVDISNIMAKRGEALEASLQATERMLHKAWEEKIEAEEEAAETRAEAQAATPLGGLGELAQQFMKEHANGAANGKA